MVVENVQVTFKESGSRTVSRRIKDIGRSSKDSNDSLVILKRTLAGFATAAGVGVVTKLADSYTLLNNRLKLVTSSAENLKRVSSELFKVSNESRSSFATTSEVYARLALSTRALGTSQREVLTLVKALNQATILSGASAKEANNGLIQLGQGLSFGALRGDELRSVLEGLPLVADVIAKELGVTRGELRLLGEQGKLTSKVIVDAFNNQAEDLESAFRDTIPTIQQSFTVLSNNALKTVGEFNVASGASESLSGAILFLAENFDILSRSLIATGAAVAALNFKSIAAQVVPGVAALGKLNNALRAGAAIQVGAAKAAKDLTATRLVAAKAALDETKQQTASLFLNRDLGRAQVKRSLETLRLRDSQRELAKSVLETAKAEQIAASAGGFTPNILRRRVQATRRLDRAQALLAGRTEQLRTAEQAFTTATLASGAAGIRSERQARALSSARDKVSAASKNARKATENLGREQLKASKSGGLLASAGFLLRKALVGVATAIRSNPVGFLVSGIVAGVAAVTLLRDKVLLFRGEATTLGDLFRSIGSRLGEGFEPALEILDNVRDKVSDTFKAISDSLPDLGTSLRAVLDFTAQLVGILKSLSVGVREGLSALPGISRVIFQEFLNAPIAAFEFLSDISVGTLQGITQFLTGEAKKLGQASRLIGEAISSGLELDPVQAKKSLDEALSVLSDVGRASNLGSEVSSAIAEQFDVDVIPRFKVKGAEAGSASALSAVQAFVKSFKFEKGLAKAVVDDLFAGADDAAAQRLAQAELDSQNQRTDILAKQAAARTAVIRSLREEGEGLTRLAGEQKVYLELQKAVNQVVKEGSTVTFPFLLLAESAIRYNAVLKDQAKIISDIRGPAEEYKNNLFALEDALMKGRISQREYSIGLEQIQSNIGAISFGQLVSDIKKEAVALDLSNQQRERQSRLIEINRDLLSKGVKLSTGQQVIIASLLKLNQGLEDQSDLLSQINGPQQEYQSRIASLSALFDAGRISIEQYNQEALKSKVAYEDSTSSLESVLGALDQEREALTKFGRAGEAERELRDKINQLRREGIEVGKQEAAQILSSIVAANKQAEVFQKIQGALRGGSEENTLRDSIQQVNSAIGEREEALSGLSMQISDLRGQIALLGESSPLSDELGLQVEKLVGKFNSGKVEINEFKEALRLLKEEQQELSTAMGAGFERGFRSFFRNLTDLGKAADTFTQNSLGKLTDALGEVLTTGRTSFKDLGRSILEEFNKLLVSAVIRQFFKLISSAFGGGSGGISGFFSGLVSGARATGGPVQNGKTYLVGENGPELFTASGNGNILPSNDTLGGIERAQRAASSSLQTISRVTEALQIASQTNRLFKEQAEARKSALPVEQGGFEGPQEFSLGDIRKDISQALNSKVPGENSERLQSLQETSKKLLEKNSERRSPRKQLSEPALFPKVSILDVKPLSGEDAGAAASSRPLQQAAQPTVEVQSQGNEALVEAINASSDSVSERLSRMSLDARRVSQDSLDGQILDRLVAIDVSSRETLKAQSGLSPDDTVSAVNSLSKTLSRSASRSVGQQRATSSSAQVARQSSTGGERPELSSRSIGDLSRRIGDSVGNEEVSEQLRSLTRVGRRQFEQQSKQALGSQSLSDSLSKAVVQVDGNDEEIRRFSNLTRRSIDSVAKSVMESSGRETSRPLRSLETTARGGTSGPGRANPSITQGSSNNASTAPRDRTVVVNAPENPLNVTVLNVSDPNEIVGALNTPAGEKTIINMLSKNKSAVKALLQ